MTPPTTFTLALDSEVATTNLMADLALLIGPGDVITLSGDLGAGKTTAARALIQYLADDDTLEVPSPTFTLAQDYDLPACPVLHADLYRINDPTELEEIGLAPLPDGVITLIEWPERAAGLLPLDRIDIALNHQLALGSNARTVNITGHGTAAAQVARLAALRQFLELSGYTAARRQRMPGDASTRSYARLINDNGKAFSSEVDTGSREENATKQKNRTPFRSDRNGKGSSAILMNAPRRPDGIANYGGKSYSAAVHLAEDIKPFVAVADGLRAHGVSAPVIHHADLNAGFLIIEDLGRTGFVEGLPPTPIAERYQAATDLLAELHKQALSDTLPLAPHLTYTLPTFDIDAMLIEVGLMLEWYLPDRGIEVSDHLRTEFATLWRDFLTKLSAWPPTWVLRDYHSPNLIWLDDRQGTARVGVIDFQDTVLGPPAYDLVSLLQDARVDVPESLEIALLARYVKARREADTTFDMAAFVESYAIMSAQRNTRLLGTFARLNRRDGKPLYLKHQPRVWTYLNRSFAHPTLSALRSWFAANVPLPEDNITRNHIAK